MVNKNKSQKKKKTLVERLLNQRYLFLFGRYHKTEDGSVYNLVEVGLLRVSAARSLDHHVRRVASGLHALLNRFPFHQL